MKMTCVACGPNVVHNKCKGGHRCTKCGRGGGDRKKALYGYSKHQPGAKVAVRMVKMGQDNPSQVFFRRDGASVTRLHQDGKGWVKQEFAFPTVRQAKAFCNAG